MSLFGPGIIVWMWSCFLLFETCLTALEKVQYKVPNAKQHNGGDTEIQGNSLHQLAFRPNYSLVEREQRYIKSRQNALMTKEN